MILIKPTFEIFDTPKTLEESWGIVEMATRTCYLSEPKADSTETSEDFCRRILVKHEDWNKNHGAMLEHGTVYLKYENELVRGYQPCQAFARKYEDNPYSVVHFGRLERKHETIVSSYVTTNLRVILENGWEEDLQYWCAPTENHEKRYTVRFICDRGVSHKEFVA